MNGYRGHTPLPAVALAAAALAAAAAGCDATSSAHRPSTTLPSPPSSSAPAKLSGAIHLVFDDSASTTTCPRRSPAGARCYEINAVADIAPYGKVTLGPTLDVEAPQGTPACGAPARYTTTLSNSLGQIDIVENGPRLCLGVVGTVQRTFTVTGGTGAYAGAAGSGTISMAILSVGASETWKGSIATHTS